MAHGLGRLIKRLRERSDGKWTLSRLGEELGVGKSYLSKVENEEIEKLNDSFIFDTLDLIAPKIAHQTGMTIRACLHALGKEPSQVEVTKLGSQIVAVNCFGPPPLIPDWSGLPELPDALSATSCGWFHRIDPDRDLALRTSPLISYVTTESFAALMARHAKTSRAELLKSHSDSAFPWGLYRVNCSAVGPQLLQGIHVLINEIAVFSTNGFDVTLSFDPDRADAVLKVLATAKLTYPPTDQKSVLRMLAEDASFAERLHSRRQGVPDPSMKQPTKPVVNPLPVAQKPTVDKGNAQDTP